MLVYIALVAVFGISTEYARKSVSRAYAATTRKRWGWVLLSAVLFLIGAAAAGALVYVLFPFFGWWSLLANVGLLGITFRTPIWSWIKRQRLTYARP